MEDSQSGKQLYHKISSHWSKGSETHFGLPSMRIWQQVEMTPEHLALKASNVCLQELHQTGGKRLWLLEGTHKDPCTPRPREMKQWPPQETGSDILARYWRVFHGVVGLGNTVGQRHLQQQLSGALIGVRYPKGCN